MRTTDFTDAEQVGITDVPSGVFGWSIPRCGFEDIAGGHFDETVGTSIAEDFGIFLSDGDGNDGFRIVGVIRIEVAVDERG